MSRPHWNNCIAHFDEEACRFIETYFAKENRRCLLVAAAGFDPRSLHVTQMLSKVLGTRLYALFIREERSGADQDLISTANLNEASLRQLVPHSNVHSIDIFGEDGAAVGGTRIATLLNGFPIDENVTDVVLDMSALSIGIGFPAAKILLADCEEHKKRAFHVIITSDPELDDDIVSEPADRAISIKGFSGAGHLSQVTEEARIWVPQLARGRKGALTDIGLSVGECYKICPVLPFPAQDPRRADNLIMEFESELTNEWQVDPRDMVYVSEHNPLDSYRTLSTLSERYDRTVRGTFSPHMILSPIGSKVMAAGALMAAIEYDLTVKYLETVRYDFNAATAEGRIEPDQIVHMLLSGPAYGDYGSITRTEEG